MALEIERKFLVKGDAWRSAGKAVACRQGYISRLKACVVRVRTAGPKAYLCVKGAVTALVRREYEYEIPFSDAEAMLTELCEKPLIQKRRHVIAYKGLTWEVDEFFGENQGLVIAELELERQDQPFEKPPWVGEEVTGDPRYYNANLVKHPFCRWSGPNDSALQE